MRYKIEEIEDQIIYTLGAALNSPSQTTQIAPHAGDVSPMTFTNPALMEGFVQQLPFVFVQYQGSESVRDDSMGTLHEDTLRFRLYVGTKSLRKKQESQRSAYSLLRAIFDALHGKWVKDGTAIANRTYLTGTTQTASEFNPQSPLIRADGRGEMLIVNLPQICVYQTDYHIRLQA